MLGVEEHVQLVAGRIGGDPERDTALAPCVLGDVDANAHARRERGQQALDAPETRMAALIVCQGTAAHDADALARNNSNGRTDQIGLWQKEMQDINDITLYHDPYDDKHGDCNGVGEGEHQADGSSKLRPQRPMKHN